MKRIRLREEARDEFLKEVGDDEERRGGTGKHFREAVNAALQLIRRFLTRGAPGPAGTRRTKVRGFPFTASDRDDPDEIVVFAIAPDRRQTGYWATRAR